MAESRTAVGTTTGLHARHELRLAFERSVGGATAAFLAGLARGEVWGGRGADGVIRVPPHDGDEPASVADAGTLRAWSWVAAPAPDQPLNRPFAYGLIQLDGADTALLHVVDVEAEEVLSPGLRVRADWRTERSGSVRDIRAFVPGATAPPAPGDAPEVLRVESDRVMSYGFEPGIGLSRFYQALAEGRIEGGRCPVCDQVHVPPHTPCPACGSAATEIREVADTGVIESVTVVHLPVAGLGVELPFAWARIRVDGADVSFPHVVTDAALDDLHVGQRVKAVWASEGERPASWEAIRHFRPVDR
jgi:uncharacterized protein